VKKFKTRTIPVLLGVFGGFDYGRVWSDVDLSNDLNTAYGGGLWLQGDDFFSIQLAMFGSDDGGRFTFGLNFGF